MAGRSDAIREAHAANRTASTNHSVSTKDDPMSTQSVATPAHVIEVERALAETHHPAFQLMLLALCGLCLVIDGFDAQAMGYVAPSVIGEWHVSKAALGPVFSASLFGMLLGALGLSVLADRIGRRPVLIGSTFFFA